MNWYSKVLGQYVNFSGRARRKEYWMFTIINTGFICIAMFIDYKIWLSTGIFNFFIYHYNIVDTGLFDYGFCYFIYVYIVLTPSIAVFIRRLHDTGKSGWMVFIVLIPLVGLIWLLILLATEGDTEENKYGLNPKTLNAINNS